MIGKSPYFFKKYGDKFVSYLVAKIIPISRHAKYSSMVEYLYLRTLPVEQRADLCREFFLRVYREAFPHDDQNEDPETWLPLLDEYVPDGQPMVHIIIARESADRVVGGLVFEHFRASGCWLATYIAVRPDARRHGIARHLMREMLNYIFARTFDAIVLAETEDPACVADGDREFAEQRLSILDSFGLRQLPFHYVQPALTEHKNPLDNLLLLCYAPDNTSWGDVPAHRISEFLCEFYGAVAQAGSNYLTKMRAELEIIGSLRTKRLVET